MTELEEFEFRKRFEMEQAAGNKAPVEVEKPSIGRALASPFVGAYRGLQDLTDTAYVAATEALGIKGARDIAEQKKAQFEQDYGGFAGANVARLGSNIAATLPVGGALAKGVSLIPGAAQKAAPLIQALRTGGFGAGGQQSGIRPRPG